MRVEQMFRDIYTEQKLGEAFNEIRARQGIYLVPQIEEIAEDEKE